MKKNSFWIIKPFNKLFNLILLVLAVLVIGSSFMLKNSSIELRKTILYIYMAFTTVVYFLYKYLLSKDKEFNERLQKEGLGKFTWWDELPLHLCNVNLFLIPLGVLLNNGAIMMASMVTAITGAFMAISMPSLGFESGSIFNAKFWGYYGFHMLLIFGGVMLVGYGIYIPKFTDIIPSVGFLLLLTTIVFVITTIIRKLHLCDYANYFYVYSPGNNLVLKFFYNIIKLPFLYVLPLAVLFGIVMALFALPFVFI